MNQENPGSLNKWPELPFNEWKETLATLQLYTQVIGKIRLQSMPWLNHSWHVTLYITPVGLTTGSMPYKQSAFEIQFNFIQHKLSIISSSGITKEIELYDRSVADFYKEVFKALKGAGISIHIYAKPNEIENPIPFNEDETHKTYNKEQVTKYWQALIQVEKIFIKFRAGFKGKCSPVHLFWGGFDLAVTRFSGRPAPVHPGGAPHIPLAVMQEAYSHEVSSCGFWPGSEAFPQAAFYSYCYPASSEFSKQPVEPEQAFYSNEMGEFILLYDDVRNAPDPEETLMRFLTTTYEAAANTGNWNRKELECNFSYLKRPAKT